MGSQMTPASNVCQGNGETSKRGRTLILRICSSDHLSMVMERTKLSTNPKGLGKNELL
jgi:hypothetical protein